MEKKTIIALIFLSGVLFFIGCRSGQIPSQLEVEKDEMTPAEKKKAELLNRLEKRYESPETHLELGQLYLEEGRWAKADHHFSIALNFDPVLREAQAGRIKSLLIGNDIEKAKLLADIYINQASVSAAASLRLALAFQRQKLDEYAMICYRRALELAPNSAKIHRQIGYYYLSRGQRDKAKEYLTRSFQLDPLQPEVAGELGRLGVEIKVPRKTEQNVQQLERIVEEKDEQLVQ